VKLLDEIQRVQVPPGHSRADRPSECCHSPGDWWVRSVHSKEAGGGEGEGNNLAQLQHELEIILAAEIACKEISMGRELDGLVISLREAGFFESGSAQRKQASAPAFDRIAALLRKRKCRLRIEGHTDNIPIHNARFSSNWELSTSRATEIVRLLIVRDGFDAYL
jgi:chemotaxis protein MotB